MKYIYILLLLFLATGLNCYAQADRPATKQQRIDAAKAFIEKGATLSPYSVKDFLQASGYIFYPETYSKDLQKRADKGDLKAMRDVTYYKALTCEVYNQNELQKAILSIHKFFQDITKIPAAVVDTKENKPIISSMSVIYYTLLEEAMGYDDIVNTWATLFNVEPGNVPVSNSYARAMINAYFKSNSYKIGDYFTIGNRLLLRNIKENEDIIGTILMIKMLKYQAHKNNAESWNSAINGYKKILYELSDGQITDVTFDESCLSSERIF